MLHALVKVVVLPLSSTGITTSCQAIYMASEIRDQECGQPALASTSALAGPAVPATRARPSMAPAAKRSSPSKAVVVVDAFAEAVMRQPAGSHPCCLWGLQLHPRAGTMS